MKRRKTPSVRIGNVTIGDNHPIAIQSMTNTDTTDKKATAAQILQLNTAGADIVRITVNDDAAAKSVPQIIEHVRKFSDVPIVGDFHFNGNLLLRKFPDCAQMLDKYRINPGNANQKNFCEMVDIALKNKKPVRIGVNGGSVDENILSQYMEKNALQKIPLPSSRVLEQAVIDSVLESSQTALQLGIGQKKLILSAKMSDVNSVIRVYEALAKKTDLALHIGLTEAGSGDEGIVKSTLALGTLLQQGIGDTIRVSLTPEKSQSRTREVEICQQILQGLEIQRFKPSITSCPGCGRTSNEEYLQLASLLNKKIVQKKAEWDQKFPRAKNLRIAVMGCVVNGPGESRQADIGIAFPGKTEKPLAQVFLKGKHHKNLTGDDIDQQFLHILEDYIHTSCR